MKRSVLAYAGLTLSVYPACAFAQQGSSPNDVAGSSGSVSSSAGATIGAPAASAARAPLRGQTANSRVEDVVVTAQRRRQNLQNVPITVEAIGGAALSQSGVSNVQDLRLVVPGIAVDSNAGFETTHLRGVGSNAVGPGIENPIALYVDGVYYASSTSSLFDFVDVAQVEVLKGPQGTLFGRNATGGLIQIITRDPTSTSRFDADVSYGNYNTVKADVYAAGAVADHLAADIAGQISHQGDGYGTNFFNGQAVYKNDIDAQLRSKWIYAPTDNTRVTAIFDYAQSHNNDITNRLIPGTDPVPGTGPVRNGSPWDTDTDQNNFDRNKSGGVSLKVEQGLSFARLTSLSAYRESSTALAFDVDASPAALQSIYPALIRDHQFSQELQLSSKKDSRITWVAGLYYFNAAGKYTPIDVFFGGQPFDPLAPFHFLEIHGTQDTSSFAGYAQATAKIFADTNLTVGVRYSYERRTIVGLEQGGFDRDPPLVNLVGVRGAVAFNSPTYRVSLDHRFTPELLAYVSFNTGFKSGGFNTGAPTDPAFRPEFLKAYEVGLKNDLFDRRLRVDVSGFYYDYQDIQEQKLELASTAIINGAGATIYGGDIDFSAAITNAFKLSGGAELLHDRFSAFPDAPLSSPQGGVPLTSASATGNQIPFSPTAVFNLTGDYLVDLYGGSLDSRVTYAYNSGYYDEVDNVLHQKAFSVLNAQIRWTSSNTRYSVAAWANNLTNTAYEQAQTSAIGVHYAQYNAPRTFGGTIGYHF